MFNFLKKIKFKRKRKEILTTKELSFSDLAGTPVILQIRINGNDTLLALVDEKNGTEFLLDHELATLLNLMIQSYNLHEAFLSFDDEK